MQKISALIITKNEEKNMESLLQNVSFADEIIVLDSYSTDKTEEICRSFEHVKFYQQKFNDFSSQRNKALDMATHNWILFLDADERLTPEAIQEIKQVVSVSNVAAYYMKRVFYFLDKPMKYTGLQNDKNIRLFQKDKCRYFGLVHEKLQINGKVGVLKNALIHYSYTNFDVFKDKMISYGKLKAQESFARGKKYHFSLKIAHSLFTLLQRYFIRFGFLDGKKGAIISYLIALSTWERYQHLKKLEEQE